MKTRILGALCALTLTACAPSIVGEPTPPPAAPTLEPIEIPAPLPGTTATPIAIDAPTRPASSDDEIAAIAAAERPPRDQIELARQLGVCRPDPAACPVVARTTPLTAEVGERRPFYVTDFDTNAQYEISAVLRYAGPVVLMYVEAGVPYDQAALEQAARTFEQEIYPRTREIFGSEVQPGVDGDNRITILNAIERSGQILGYFSSSDSLPTQINRFSNEREMFFMNIDLMDFDSYDYLDVLAHEFQHMVHQNEQPNAATWFNEGSSQLAEDLNGFQSDGFIPSYLQRTDTQLTGWAIAPGRAGAHYGAAHLFLRYIYAHYAGEEQIRPLIRADAGDNLQAFVDLAAQTRPAVSSFSQIVADWAVANLIDDPTVDDGRYSYETGTELANLLPLRVRPETIQASFSDDVAQFGVDYLALPAGTGEVSFRGATSARIAGELPLGRFAWWGNRSDDSVATLTRAFDLRGLRGATLEFATWYEIEDDYDYAFVTVSTDGGATWQSLPGTLTTDEDPQGVNYGNGITSVSGRPGVRLEDGERGLWANERMDLSAYVGQEILLRFWSINDQGFNAPGILIDDIAIPELGYRDDVEGGAAGWEAVGFVRVDGDLPQRWELRLVRTGAGGATRVDALPVDAEGVATATLAPGERGVLVVIAATPHTSERASYLVESR